MARKWKSRKTGKSKARKTYGAPRKRASSSGKRRVAAPVRIVIEQAPAPLIMPGVLPTIPGRMTVTGRRSRF